MEPKILFEDASLVVIDKPSGLIVHDGKESVSGWFTSRFRDVAPLSWPYRERAGIVHRLDQETSGALVLAKTPEALAKLQEAFKEHKIKKIYWALVFGHPDAEQGSIDVPIGRHPTGKTPMAVVPIEEVARGKVRSASTDYKVIEKFKEVALIEATLHTGRTHQIRLHLKYIGHPILGDDIYGTKPSRNLSKSIGITRLMLHAKILGFPHPKSGKWAEFEAPLPSDFETILRKLQSY